MNTLPEKLERVLFLLLVGALFFAPFDLHPVRDILIGLTALVWVARRVLLRDFRLPAHPLTLPFGCFIVLALFSSLVSPEPLAALDGFRSDPLKFTVLFLATLDTVKGVREIRWLVAAVLVAMGILGLVGAVGWFAGHFVTVTGEGQTPRAISWNSSYTFLALFLLIGLMLAVAVRPHVTHAYARFGVDAATAVGLVTLVLTFTRGAWVAAFFGLVLLVALLRRRGPAYALAGLVLLFFFLSGLTTDRVMSIFRLPDYARVAIPNRLPNWEVATAMVRDRPVLGMGAKTSIMTEIYRRHPQYHTVDLPGFRPLSDAHNTYLQVILECGIPGLLALLWFFFAFGLAGLRTRRIAPEERFRNDAFAAVLAASAGLWLYGLVGHFWSDELGQILTVLMAALTAGAVADAASRQAAGEGAPDPAAAPAAAASPPAPGAK